MGMTPTARTLNWLRKQGFTCGVVEKWIPQTRRRQDFCGGIDIIAFKANPARTVGIQATSLSNVNSRVKKLLGLPQMRIWIAAGNSLWVVGWVLKGPRGKRKLWTPVITDMAKETWDD